MSELIDKFKELATPKVFKEGVLAELLQIDGVVLAGGAIRDTLNGEEPKDYDIFFTLEGAFEKASALLLRNISLIDKTAYTHTYRGLVSEITVQLIHKKVYLDKNDVIKEFDFTATQFAIDKSGIAVGDKSLEDTMAKLCRVNVITKPLSSLNRLVRYQELKYEVKDAYDYILSVMQTQPHGIILGAENSFYESDEEEAS